VQTCALPILPASGCAPVRGTVMLRYRVPSQPSPARTVAEPSGPRCAIRSSMRCPRASSKGPWAATTADMDATLRGRRGPCRVGWPELEQHPDVAQRVGLGPGQVEELRHPGVVRAEQLGVDVHADRGAGDRDETVAREEVDLEGEAEDALEVERPGPFHQRVDDAVPHAPALEAPVDGDGTDLGDVVPQ